MTPAPFGDIIKKLSQREEKELKLTQNPDKTSLFKRLVLLNVGLFLSALGVALLKKAALDVSPISSAANVVSIAVPGLSLGTWLMIWNCILILGQLLLLRREGTLAAALLTGVFINLFGRLMPVHRSAESAA